MKYAVYKLEFHTGAHFGNGMLSGSEMTFCADTLFSALYIEALSAGLADELYRQVQDGDILLSDAFPYSGDQYYIPKPMIYVEPKQRGDSTLKKKFKKLKYIPVQYLDQFLTGDFSPELCEEEEFGTENSQVMAAVRREEETLPYVVGDFCFRNGCGLYLILGYTGDEQKILLDELLESLSYTGIGGKRSSGKGKFELKVGRNTTELTKRIEKTTGKFMLLSSALPRPEELENTLQGASYLLKKRSGFVYSENFSEEPLRKKDMYTMQAGSCFERSFAGDVYDVGEGGSHPVYRYAKAMFLRV